MRELNDVSGLTAADLMHRHVSTLQATTTVRELSEYFAASSSRRLALIVDGDRFLGSITPADLPDGPDDAPVTRFVQREPLASVCDPAADARDKALAHPSRRVPVIDGAGALAGIVAITGRLDGFCGT